MDCQSLRLSGLKLLTPRVHADARGFFMESYHQAKYHDLGIVCKFVQDNHSRSRRGTIRGMHFARNPGQDKLVRVLCGEIWDVAVDIRPDSPTFGQYEAVTLDAVRHQQLFVPKGFAHGFCVLSEVAEVLYKVSAVYDAAQEDGFRFDDPDVGIAWPTQSPEISPRDANAQRLRDCKEQLAQWAKGWRS